MRPSLVELLREEIAADEAQLAAKRRALTALESPAAQAPMSPRRGRITRTVRRLRVMPGTLESRILEVRIDARAPMRKAPIVEAVKAKPHHVARALSALCDAGRIRALGATVSRRFALPAFAKDRAAQG